MEDSYLVDPPVVICLSQRLCHACARGLHCQNLYDSTWVHQKGFYAKKQIYLSPCISTYIHISHIYIYLHLNITSMNMYVHTLHPFIHAYWLNINICTNICKYVHTHTYMHYILHTIRISHIYWHTYIHNTCNKITYYIYTYTYINIMNKHPHILTYIHYI